MNRFYFWLAPVALICGSGLALVSRPPAASISGGSAAAPVVAPPRPNSTGSRNHAPGSGHGLASLQKTILGQEAAAVLTAEESAAISRMSDPELQDLLIQLSNDSKKKESLEKFQARYAVSSAAAAVLYERDSAAAMDWAQSLGTDVSAVTGLLIRTAAGKDPVLAATWLQRRRKDLGENFASMVVSSLVPSAPLHGAEAALEVERILAQKPEGNPSFPRLGSDYDFTPSAYAEDFDFGNYVRNSSRPLAVSHATAYWAARDPDSAWAGLRASLPDRPGLFGDMTAGIAAVQGEDAAARWASARLDDQPVESRAALIESLATPHSLDGSLSSNAPVPDNRMQAVMKALGTEQDQVAFAGRSFSPQDDGKASVAALELLPTPELQLQALRASAEGFKADGKRYNTVLWTGFQSAMEKLKLSEDAQREIRGILVPEK